MRDEKLELLLAYEDENDPVLGDGLPRASSDQAPKPKKAVRGGVTLVDLRDER